MKFVLFNIINFSFKALLLNHSEKKPCLDSINFNNNFLVNKFYEK